jgi:hypothetical protein
MGEQNAEKRDAAQCINAQDASVRWEIIIIHSGSLKNQLPELVSLSET